MDKMISIFKALSDQNRLRILAALTMRAELCACQINELLQVSGATTSRHLDVLIAAGLIDKRKDGRWVYYRLKDGDGDFAPVMNWIKNEFSKSEDIKNCLKTLTSCEPKSFCNNQKNEE